MDTRKKIVVRNFKGEFVCHGKIEGPVTDWGGYYRVWVGKNETEDFDVKYFVIDDPTQIEEED